MKNKFSKFINLQGKYLTSLLFVLFFAVGQMWADPTGVAEGTYELSSSYKPGSNKRFKSIGTGIYLHRVNNSSWNDTYGMKLKDNQNGVAFYISSAMDVTFRYYKNSNSKAETTTFSVYTISSADYALFTGGTENSTNIELSLGDAISTKTIELVSTYKDYKETDAISLSAGYYYIVGKDDTSNGTTYWTSLTLASSCAAPTGLTVGGGGEYTAGTDMGFEASATDNVDDATLYTWYKGDTWDAAKVTTPVQAAKTNAQSGRYFHIDPCALGDAGTYWCSAANGTCEAHASVTVTVVPAGGTKYDITYNNTKGATNPNPAQYTEGVGVASFTALSDVDGFHFTGWNPPSIAADASGDKTINATWVPTYNVSFDKGAGGGTAPAGFQKWENATFDLPGQGDMVAPEGKAFGGWKVGVSDKYAAGDTYTMGTTSVEFIAQWDVLVEQVIYSWEGAEGGATEVGGTVAGSADGLINQLSAGYYCLKIDGNNSYSGNLVTITLSGEEKVKTGDKITYWGFYNKSSSANARPKMRDANSPNAQIFDDPNNLPNLNGGGDPAERTFTVPAGINTNAVQLTRSLTGSNTWISKLQIVREKAVPEEDLRTVTFNTNGGSSIAAVKVEKGTAVAKPADPTKAHCRFEGWQLSGSDYNFSSAVNSDITLDAVWTQLYTISFAAGDGTGDAPAAVADKAQGETFPVPANTFTAPASKEFDKWNDGTTDYAPGDTYTVGTANVVLTAQWKALVAKYTVIFKDGDVTLDTKLFDVGSNPSDAEINKTKALSTFAAWQKDEADIALDAAFWATVAKDATVTLNARWAKAYASSIDMEGYVEANGTSANWQTYLGEHGYAFSTSNVSLDAKASGKTYENWPYQGLKAKEVGAYVEGRVNAGKLVTIKLGHMAAAATVTIDGVAQANATGLDAAEPAGAMNYYYVASEGILRYETTNAGACVLKALTIQDPYTVSFDANGGDAVASMQGTPSITLPSATKGTDSFLGWFDALDNKIGEAGESYTPTANITLVAHWESISTDARLASITFSSNAGTLSPAFDPEVTNYTYTMPYPTAAVPTIVSATSVNANAQTPVIEAQAANWNETAIIRGKAQSGDTKAYNITMKLAPKDGVCLVWADATGNSAMTVDTDKSLLAASASASNTKNTSNYGGKTGYKFNSRPANMSVTLTNETFQEGDVVEVFVTTVTDDYMRVFDENTNTDAHILAEETGFKMVQGANRLVLPATSTNSLYLLRGAENDPRDMWNPYVAYIAVYRPMNPVLTAISLAGVAAEKGTGDAFSVTLPNGTNLGTMAVVPTIVRNAAHATTPEAVVGGAWAWGANTYRVMDKDGDYTDYTITLTEAAAPSAAPVITAQPQSAEYIEGATIVALEVVATGSGELSYQWYLGADAINGATAATYTPAVSAIGSYVYHCVVTNTEAGHPATSLASANATITIAEDPAAIKLVGATGAINTTDFTTGVTAGTVNFEDADHKCAVFGDANVTDITNCQYLAGMVQYNARTNKTKVKLDFYTTSGGKKAYLFKMVEGGNVETIEIDMPTAGRYTTEYYTFNSESNRSIYVGVSDRGKVNLLQMKVIDDGATTLKRFGEAGYSLNLNKSRLMARTDATVNFEGMTVTPAAHNRVNYSTYLSLKSDRDPVSFTIAAPVTMTVVNGSSNKYYVSTSTTDLGDEYGNGSNEFDLTAGTWYIVPKNTSAVQLTSIAFAAPKCAEPQFNALQNSDVCAGDPYVALDGTATVADAGTPIYQWYNAEGDEEIEGATDATYTPTADGSYYVIATNQLAGYTDNVKKSATVTVTTYASAAITTAPEDQRVDAGENATLSVVATGKAPLTYQWYTCDENGDNAAIIAGAENSSYVVAVTDGMSQYFKVVVTSGCGEASAVAKVEAWVELPQLDVTESMTWDWTYAGENIKLTDETTPKKNEECVMANVKVGNKMPTNDATFRSQALLFYGENVRATDGGRNYASVGHISFNTTVPGIVEVEFSDNGTNNRRLKINDYMSESSSSKTDVKTFKVYVQAGEVTLMGVKNDGTNANQYIRISKITFTANPTPDYTREVTNNIGTLCVDHNVLAGGFLGATFYQIASRNELYNDKIDFEEVLPSEELKAGEPYIFKSTTGRIDLFYGETSVTEPVPVRGMIGNFAAGHLDITEENKSNILYIASNKLWSCGDLLETGLILNPNRAYIDMSQVPTYEDYTAPQQQQNNAPRRRVTLSRNAEQVATGIEQISQESRDKSQKLLINGQLFILRGEKIFDATGRLVK